jgi:hypothetical protein
MFKLILLMLTVLHCVFTFLAALDVGRPAGFCDSEWIVLGGSAVALAGPAWTIASMLKTRLEATWLNSRRNR